MVKTNANEAMMQWPRIVEYPPWVQWSERETSTMPMPKRSMAYFTFHNMNINKTKQPGAVTCQLIIKELHSDVNVISNCIPY